MTIRHMGYACICMTLSDGIPAKRKILTSRTLRLKSFSINAVNDLIVKNCQDLLTILKWNADHDIKFFRISSEVFPFMDHPDLQYTIDDLPDSALIRSLLKQCGDFAKDNDIRLSSHPGPYNCLGSPNPDVVHKTVLSLDMHSILGELLGVDDFVINIHVGGTYGGEYDATASRFCDNFNLLQTRTKNWLTVENDDKASGWSVTKLYDLIHERIGIPIICDVHHWLFCHDETIEDAVRIALSTWGNRVPKIHYSESAEGKRPQAHSDFIKQRIPDYCPDIEYDIMLECKQKEKALLEYRKEEAVPA